jgi:hypothetical protein
MVQRLPGTLMMADFLFLRLSEKMPVLPAPGKMQDIPTMAILVHCFFITDHINEMEGLFKGSL